MIVPEQTTPSETASVRSTVSTSGPNAARPRHKSNGTGASGLDGDDEEDTFEDAEDGQTNGERVRVVFLVRQKGKYRGV